eukprot:1194917-Prorocentrum_minimum.AAC.10
MYGGGGRGSLETGVGNAAVRRGVSGSQRWSQECRIPTLRKEFFLDDARPPPTDPLGDASRRRGEALGSSDRLARPGNVKEKEFHFHTFPIEWPSSHFRTVPERTFPFLKQKTQ